MNDRDDFQEALQEISEAKGAFSQDPFEHARNCVRDMQALAIEALTKYGITPRGKPVE
jgi:Cu2+-containing amine oxidase